MDKKLKSKVTSFQVLGTNPIDYSLVLQAPNTDMTHCQLCGSALDYSFRLSHKDSTEENKSKDLLIGSDCVENFMEAYFPLKKEIIRSKMKDLIESTKSSLFLENNKDIEKTVIFIRNYISSDLRKESLEKNFMTEYYSLLRSDFYTNISKDIKSVTRKKYLSKPKTEKIKKLYKMIKKTGLFFLLEECRKDWSFKIKDVKEKDIDFYNIYLKYYSLYDSSLVLERQALNNFQKQNFLNKIKNKEHKIEIIKGIY